MAIANHFLATFSKIESFRPYARGTWAQFLLYVIISSLLFLGLVIVTITLLLSGKLYFHWFLVVVILWFISLIVWITNIYWKKRKAEKESGTLGKSNDTYSRKRFCHNCLTEMEIYIPTGIPFRDYPCSVCKVLGFQEEKNEATLQKNSLQNDNAQGDGELKEYRDKIFLWYVLWVIVFLIPAFILWYCGEGLVEFWFIQLANLLFCLSAAFWGTAYRAKWVGKDSKGKNLPDHLQPAYRFKYPLLNIAIASLVFAYLTNQQLKFDWLFYLFAFPMSYFLSVIGYGIFAIVNELANWLNKFK